MSEQEIKDRVQTRSYGAVRLGKVVEAPGVHAAGDRAIVLAPETYASPEEAERAIRTGKPGEWAVIRLVRTLTVGRETVVKATVTEGPAL